VRAAIPTKKRELQLYLHGLYILTAPCFLLSNLFVMALYHHVFVFPNETLSVHLSHWNPLHHASRAVKNGMYMRGVPISDQSASAHQVAVCAFPFSTKSCLYIRGHNFNVPSYAWCQRRKQRTRYIEQLIMAKHILLKNHALFYH
jgi:hypothetical protein